MMEQNLQLPCRYNLGWVPISVTMKVEIKEGEGSEFIVLLINS